MKRREAERKELLELSVTIDKIEASKKLKNRLGELASANGFIFGTVSIRNQKTRWGSCSQNGNISLNVKLVLLPEELMDYVILHELIHTRIQNHGKGFWKELDKYAGDSKALATRLRKYGYNLL